MDTVGTAERRNAILKVLCRRRHETIGNLASEFGVSERTIRRDIEVLSYSEPIYTQAGRYAGGVYVVDGYTIDRVYMSSEEIRILNKLYECANQKRACELEQEELNTLKSMIRVYSKPSRGK